MAHTPLMNRSTPILSAALILVSGGSIWLAIDNHRLRNEQNAAAEQTPPEIKKSPPVLRSPMTAGGAATGHPASKDAKPRDSGKAPVSVVKDALFQAADNGDGTFTVSDAAGTWQQKMTTEEWRDFKQKMDRAIAASAVKGPDGPSWSPGKAAGAPDTANFGDYATAWASQSPDGGKEWLQLKYAKSVEIGEINIHETYNPGALAKVVAIMPDGSEKTIWQGTEDTDTGIVERAVKVPKGIRSDQIRIELDTSRVPGWNEIDAVEMVGTDGSHQWATESTASSYYGEGRESGGLESTRLYSETLSLEGGEMLIQVR